VPGNNSGFEELPSILGYTYLRADDLKNINMNTKTRDRSLYNYRKDLETIYGSAIDVSTSKGKLLKQSIMTAFRLEEKEFQEQEFYRVPLVHPVRDWHEFDNFYKEKLRGTNQVYNQNAANMAAEQTYDAMLWLQRTGGSVLDYEPVNK
jgi:hypothetical protein